MSDPTVIPEAYLQALGEMTSCCGRPKSAAEPLWDEATHLRILDGAIQILKSIPATDPAHARASEFVNMGKAFHDAVKEGLKEADKDVQYGGKYGLHNAYYMHFYDPDTRDTILGQDRNAMTECLRRYHMAAATFEANRAALADAGFQLGLALHYLTDLTQPMHAAKFANLLPMMWPIFRLDDWRHWYFEEYADKRIVPVPAVTADQVRPENWKSPGQLVTAASRFAKNIFTTKLSQVLYKKLITQPGDKSGYIIIDNSWGKEADPIIDEAMPHAYIMAAAFLLYWMTHLNYGVVHQIYQRLLGRNADQSGINTWGHGQLAGGATMKSVVRAIALSEESIGAFKARSTDDAIRLLYNRLLARDAEPGAFGAWGGWIGQGRYADSINFIVDEAEYTQRFGPHILPYPL